MRHRLVILLVVVVVLAAKKITVSLRREGKVAEGEHSPMRSDWPVVRRRRPAYADTAGARREIARTCTQPARMRIVAWLYRSVSSF